MIVLFTDFGPSGPYLGQMKAVLYRANPTVPVIDLLSNAPSLDPRASAYLLAAYSRDFPPPAVFLAVIDPGVGGSRAPVALKIDGRWFVGPDNGLFNVVAMRGREVEWWDITWRPSLLSATFHGRDLFAPVAARLAAGEQPLGERREAEARIDRTWPADDRRVIYFDYFGNAITGVRAESAPTLERLSVSGYELSSARTYSDVPRGQAFWYENSSGLIEIAVHGGSACERLGLKIGDAVTPA